MSSQTQKDPSSARETMMSLPPEQRAEEVQVRLRGCVAKALGIPAGEVDAQRGLTFQGVDSVMALGIRNQIEAELGVAVSVVSLLSGGTLANLASEILSELSSGQARSTRAEDELEADAVLDPRIRPKTVTPPSAKPAELLLTGATGFAGSFLLHELLQQTQARIHCLVRAPDEEQGRRRIAKTLDAYRLPTDEAARARIVPVPGDLSKPLLGLSQERFKELSGKLEAIYHCGALVNFVFPYFDLRPTNVVGTQEILRLACLSRVKSLHFMSSVAVFFSNQYAGKRIGEEEVPARDAGLSFGYAQSKWVAEQLALAARARGLPVSIYRPGFIGWDTRTGAFNVDDFLCALLRSCAQMKTAPILDMEVEVAPVDYVTRAMVHISLQPSWAGKSFHFVNPKSISWAQVVEACAAAGHPLATVPYGEWRQALMEPSTHEGENDLRLFLPLIPEPGADGDVSLVELLSRPRAPVYDCTNTLQALEGSGIVCPPVDRELLATYLRGLTEHGYLEPPAS